MVGRLVVLILAASPSLCLGKDLLACLDSDVKEGLLFQGFGQQAAVTDSLPEKLRDIPVPTQFEFIGSSTTSFQTAGAYKATMTPENALHLTQEAFEDAGWETLSRAGMGAGGFVSGAQPQYNMVCRKNEMITIMARPGEGTTFINLSASNRGRGEDFSCDAMRAAQGSSIAVGMLDASKYLPRLSLPDGARNAATFGFGSFGSRSGGDRSASTSIAIDTELTTQDLIQHFAAQLEEQGWTYDSGWAGRQTAGSSWTAKPEQDVDLIGLLDVVALQTAGYQATFRATRVD